MKTIRLLCRAILPLAVSGMSVAITQSGNGLLLPFPVDAAAESTPANPGSTVPDRTEAPVDDNRAQDARRAMELADTFIRRQQAEVTNSVPRRGIAAARVPSRAAAPRPAIAFRSGTSPAGDSGGPVSELLPLPGETAGGDFIEAGMPESEAILPGSESLGQNSAPAETSPHEVPRSDLAPGPAHGGVEVQEHRGPVFRVNGAEAFKVARARGFKFTPADGIGARNGVHTAASQFPNVLTSEVHGTQMSQLRPPQNWSVTETSNTFFMFCDAGYNAVRLTPGWRIRGIKLKGPAWRWVACPRSGAGTASFSIRVHAYKGQDAATTVALEGLTLEGPQGATDWKEAFPWLNGKGPAVIPQPTAPGQPGTAPEALAAAPANATGEPPLPE